MIVGTEVQENEGALRGRGGGVVGAVIVTLHCTVPSAPITRHLISVVTFLRSLYHSISTDCVHTAG